MSFTAPIGDETERASGRIWPGKWVDATGFDKLYSLGPNRVFHTGADLNLNFPSWNSDRHAKIYAIGDGTVTYARRFSATAWGNIVIIDHGTVDGGPLFSRYGHVENMQVAEGDAVQAGQQIAAVGNADGLFSYHLHFDISTTDILRTRPGHWPAADRNLLRLHYVDPQLWLQAHVTENAVSGTVLPSAHYWYVIASLGLRVRRDPGKNGIQEGSLLYGTRVLLDATVQVEKDSYIWGLIAAGKYRGDWLAMGKADHSETYMSRTKPVG